MKRTLRLAIQSNWAVWGMQTDPRADLTFRKFCVGRLDILSYNFKARSWATEHIDQNVSTLYTSNMVGSIFDWLHSRTEFSRVDAISSSLVRSSVTGTMMLALPWPLSNKIHHYLSNSPWWSINPKVSMALNVHRNHKNQPQLSVPRLYRFRWPWPTFKSEVCGKDVDWQ